MIYLFIYRLIDQIVKGEEGYGYRSDTVRRKGKGREGKEERGDESG
jgi:hypothetical protein